MFLFPDFNEILSKKGSRIPRILIIGDIFTYIGLNYTFFYAFFYFWTFSILFIILRFILRTPRLYSRTAFNTLQAAGFFISFLFSHSYRHMTIPLHLSFIKFFLLWEPSIARRPLLFYPSRYRNASFL